MPQGQTVLVKLSTAAIDAYCPVQFIFEIDRRSCIGQTNPWTRRTERMTQSKDNALAAMFPEGTMTLEEADPELYGIIKQEKRRQRYAVPGGGGGAESFSNNLIFCLETPWRERAWLAALAHTVCASMCVGVELS